MANFYRGVLFLAASAFLGESIEFLVNMILTKELGKHGLGLYMSILPSIFFIFLLSSFELQVSISKFIAEKEERYHRNIVHHAITIAIVFTSILFLLAVVVIPFVSVFNSYHPYTRWLVIILIPIVSFTSVARGYFMGKQQMGKLAVSNILRKAFQVAVLFGIFRFFQFDAQTAVFIALATFIGSEMVVFLYLVCTFFIQFQQMKRLPFSNLNQKVVRKNLMAVSIPTTGLRLFVAFTNAVQPFIMKAALIRSGLTEHIATEQFGMLAGVAISIGFFPAFIAHSLLVVLIPTVSKAYSERDHRTLQKMLNHVIRITFLYGIPAVTIFYFLGNTLTTKFFHSAEAAVYLQILWPFFLFHFFIIPTQAFMIGLGLIKDIFLQTVWATAISYTIILWLGSLPEWRMVGVMIGMNMGAVLLSFMHYVTICKKIGVPIVMRGLIQKG